MARLKILPRADWYFIRSFLIYFVLCLSSLMALITVGDLLQNTDEFAAYAKNHHSGIFTVIYITMQYYSAYSTSFVLKTMLPLVLMLAGVFTVTSATVNNEYTVLRSSGISMQRALLPILVTAFLIGMIAEWSQDLYLPYLMRKSYQISNEVRPRAAKPVALVVPYKGGNQHIAIGYFESVGGYVAHNLLLEIRQPFSAKPDGNKLGKRSTVIIYRAQEAYLVKNPETGTMEWKAVRGGKKITQTWFSQRVEKWSEAVPTLVTPAMLERKVLGEEVMTWKEMGKLADSELGVRLEMYRRRSEAWGGVALLLLCLGLILRRYVRGETPNYVKNILIGMFTCVGYYLLRKVGISLGSDGTLPAVIAVFAPVLVVGGVGIWFYRDLEHYA